MCKARPLFQLVPCLRCVVCVHRMVTLYHLPSTKRVLIPLSTFLPPLVYLLTCLSVREENDSCIPLLLCSSNFSNSFLLLTSVMSRMLLTPSAAFISLLIILLCVSNSNLAYLLCKLGRFSSAICFSIHSHSLSVNLFSAFDNWFINYLVEFVCELGHFTPVVPF